MTKRAWPEMSIEREVFARVYDDVVAALSGQRPNIVLNPQNYSGRP